jgi:hypothetical protein
MKNGGPRFPVLLGEDLYRESPIDYIFISIFAKALIAPPPLLWSMELQSALLPAVRHLKEVGKKKHARRSENTIGSSGSAKAPTFSFSFTLTGKINENGNKQLKKPFKCLKWFFPGKKKKDSV